MAWKTPHFAAFLAFIYFAAVSLRHYVFHADEPVRPGFAVSEAPEDILTALRWYADSAVGALHPLSPRALFPRALSPQDLSPQALVLSAKEPEGLTPIPYSKALHERLHIFDGCTEGADAMMSCPSPKIRAEHLNTVWWPGMPYPEGVFLYSPFTYEVSRIVSVVPGSHYGSPTLKVKFIWKVMGLSRTEQVVRELRLLPKSAEAEPPSSGIEQEIELLSSKYGYFLPLTREPLLPSS